MKANYKFRTIVFETASAAFVLLFSYAATSKLADFDNFQVQLGQSPMTSVFSTELSYAVPIAEYAIAVLFLVRKYRMAAMYMSFTLMTAFSAYIFIILNYSAYVPCSCGGVLEKLGWKEHLVFNLGFVLLSLLSIVLYSSKEEQNAERYGSLRLKSKIFPLAGLALIASLSIATFFHFSEERMKFHNSFIRRFPPHMADRLNDIDLKFNSYYLAGIGEGKIFLGNTTTPLYVTVLDTALNLLYVRSISLDKTHAGMRHPQVRIAAPEIFVYEGSGPYIYRGTTSTWDAVLHRDALLPFSQLQPLGKGRVAVRFNAMAGGAPALGTINAGLQFQYSARRFTLDENTSEDAIFRADGLLVSEAGTSRLHYVYYYRNRFITAGPDLQNVLIGKTIDTVSNPSLKLARIASRNEKTFAEMPLLVNRLAAADSGWLFVNSQLRGRDDPESLWNSASLLDIYDTRNGAYLASAYLHDIEGRKVSSFLVSDGYIYALTGRRLVRYVLRRELVGNR